MSLAEALESYGRRSLDAFRSEYPPAPSSPEFSMTWGVVGAAGDLLGIRVSSYVFAGASGGASARTFWYDTASQETSDSADLIEPAQVNTTLMLIDRQLKQQKYAVTSQAAELSPDQADSTVLTSLGFTADGSLVATLDEGALTSYSEGTPTLVIPAEEATPLLSAAGRKIQQGIQAHLPFSGDSLTPTAAPSTAKSTQDAVDCAVAKCVALTFDDGPGPYTAQILDDLSARNAVATFFVLGQNAAVLPDLVQREASLGMEIGNHTWDHRDLRKLSATQTANEFSRTAKVVAAITGSAPKIARPPYGSYNSITRAAGLPLVNWSIDTEDWKNRNTAITTQRALTGVKPGSIILVHDIHASTAKAVPAIVDGLREQGFTLVTVSQLFGGELTGGKVYLSQHSIR